MSYGLALAALLGTGVAMLRILGLATGRPAVDLVLGWFIGGGWFALAMGTLRLLVGLPYTAWSAGFVLAIPVLLCIARAWAGRGPPRLVQRSESSRSIRPRPVWLFGPLIAYVMVVAYATAVHGINTPTQTDDGVRVRAFAPMLAFDDEWSPEARKLLPLAGTVPTFVPSLAWRFTGQVDHFHVNDTVVTSFLALLVLVIGLGSARERPEHGWAGAFALSSLPLFVYHGTATYSDAVLAIHVGAGFLFALEYDRTRDPRDAARAVLLFVIAAFVKREGMLVATVAAAPLLLQTIRRRRQGDPVRPLLLLCFFVPWLLDLAIAAAAVGIADSLPILELVRARAQGPAAFPAAAVSTSDAAASFARALFRSGNQGMLYWILALVIPFRLAALVRSGRTVPLLTVAALFLLCTASSIWIIPAFTLDETTVHRALFAVSVPAALWLAGVLVDWVGADWAHAEDGVLGIPGRED